MDEIYEDIDGYYRNKNRKTLIAFDDKNADMLSNKTFNLIVTKTFIVGKTLNISFVLIIKFCFYCTKNNSLNSTHYFTVKF